MDDAPWLVTNEHGEVVDRAPTRDSALETVREYSDVADLHVRHQPRT